MKKFILGALAVAALSLCGLEARAGSCNPYPYTLVNGQIADANQVMADFNLVRNCFINNGAAKGANSDIISLSGLTTPLSVAQGGTGATTTAGITAGVLTPGRTIGITGDLTYTSPVFTGAANITAAGTLATVNSNVGSFAGVTITVNAKGLVTAASATAAATTATLGPTTLATGAQVVTGTNTTNAVTPASLTSQLSLAGNGYVVMPGGLIMEWGVTGTITGGASSTITLPLAFPTSGLSLSITRIYSSAVAQAMDTAAYLSATQFSISNNSTGNDSAYYWIALGK